MAITEPPLIDPLPAPPSTADFVNFDLRADAFNGALPGLQAQVNAAALNVYQNALQTKNNADDVYINTVATASNTVMAAQYAGAAPWVSGQAFALGVVAWSTANRRLYRKLTGAAGGATDPSADPANWGLINPGIPYVPVTGTAQAAAAGGAYSLQNVAATTLTLPSNPAENAIVYVLVANGLGANVIDPNGKSFAGPSGPLAGPMTLDNPVACVAVQYINSLWRLVK